MKICNRTLLPLTLSLATVASAAAGQTRPGTRAAGMAGAFVAVADDASAVYWNPAGVATGSFVSAVADFGKVRPGHLSQQPSANQWDTVGMVAFSATAIGLAYYRFDAYGTQADQPAVSGSRSREEVRRSVHVTTSTVGVSLLQSLNEHVVVGATPKVVRGNGATAIDVDAGVMFWVDRVRLGLVARNLATPAFDKAAAGKPDEGEIELAREVRAGAAWGSGWTGLSRVIVSLDGDVIARATASGDRRDLAAGVETWWKEQRLGLRGGLRRSTIGHARAAVAAGVSAGLTPGMLVEAHLVRGHADERSWSIGARMTF